MKPALVLGVAALALAIPVRARADSASSAEVRALASRAASDPAALSRLRRVDTVDGRRVELARALEGAEGAELRARLRALAAGDSGMESAGDPAADAQRILNGRRFHESRVPRPFHSLLAWLGDRLRAVSRPFRWLADSIPGGSRALWVLVGLAVLAAAAFVAGRLGQRRTGIALERVLAERGERRGDPAKLEREADAAERRGELEAALRLRFRAGLIRLERAEAIPTERALTSGQVRRILRLREFDDLASGFDEVVYGRRTPHPDDVVAARRGWPLVLERVQRR